MIKAPVSREQTSGLRVGVSPDQKVQDSGALPALSAMRSLGAACEKKRFSRQCLNPDLVAFEKCVAVRLVFKMDAKFRVNDVADDERADGRRVLMSSRTLLSIRAIIAHERLL